MSVRPSLLVAGVVTAVVAGSLTLVSQPASAAAASGQAIGRYTALASTRVLNTRTTTPVASGRTRSFTLPSSVPTTATAVVLNLTVAGATGTGYVTAYAGTRPGVSTVNYVRARTVSNATTVALDGTRTVTVYNQGGTVDLFADLSGYIAPGPGRVGAFDALGGFASVGPTRVLDTRKTRTPVAAGKAINLKVTGTAIPRDASAVLVNLTVVSPAASGYLTGYPTGATRPGTSNLTFATGRGVAGLALVPIGDLGNIAIFNGSTKAVQVLADVQGFVAGGEPTSVGAFSALVPQRLVDTRATTAVAGKGTLTVPVVRRGGVPVAHVAAVVLTLTTTAPTANGFLVAYGDQRPSTSDLTFTTGQTVSNLVVVRPDADGRVTIFNGAPGRTQVLVDVAGYVYGRDVTVPGTTTSRYVSDPAKISATGDTSEGYLDGDSGASFVLLDIGAQSRSGDLGPQNPGVSLVFNNPAKRLTYPELVTALNAYVDEFARGADGRSARIALGTSNDGVFRGVTDDTAYPAVSRGKDWALQVVDKVQAAAPAGITVVGANDIEAGFASTEADAEAWTTQFLNDTDADLVYNGSLDACSDDYAKPMSCRAVKDNNGVTKTWTPAQYVRLTHGLGPGRISVLPQIYYSVPSQAAQWRNLFVASGNALIFEGSLAQFSVSGGVAGGYDGAQGWSALYHALSTVVENPVIPVATDLAKT